MIKVYCEVCDKEINECRCELPTVKMPLINKIDTSDVTRTPNAKNNEG